MLVNRLGLCIYSLYTKNSEVGPSLREAACSLWDSALFLCSLLVLEIES